LIDLILSLPISAGSPVLAACILLL